MKLLEWVDWNIKVAPEALLVRPIRKLYNADRTRTKETFMKQMSYLFFMVDPRSTYAYIVDDNERARQIIQQEGLPEDFKPSDDLKEAMDIYAKHTVTSSSRLLQSTRVAVDALAEELENTDSLLKERTDKGARVTKQNDIITTLDRVLSLIPRLQELERKVNDELKETTRARGAETSMFEDGI